MAEEKSLSMRNSILELFRFIFAIWVVYYHGFVPFKNQYFSHGYLSVDFFFILSGFFFIASFNKIKDLPFFKGLFTFLWKRFKNIAFIFLPSMAFSIWYWVLNGCEPFGMFGFLWFIEDLFIVLFVLFILRKLIKNDKIFYIVIGLLAITCCTLSWSILSGNGYMRAFGGIAIGILLSIIPKIKKYKNLQTIILILISLIGIFLALIPNKTIWFDMVFISVIFPTIIYFSYQIEVNIPLFNYLGSLSFGLYAFQCVLRILEYYNMTNTTILFIILLTLTIVANEKSFIKFLSKSKKFRGLHD